MKGETLPKPMMEKGKKGAPSGHSLHTALKTCDLLPSASMVQGSRCGVWRDNRNETEGGTMAQPKSWRSRTLGLAALLLCFFQGAEPFVVNTSTRRGVRGKPLHAKREDKWEILNAFGKKPWELDGESVVTAWDKLSRKSVSEGPRKGHLPPLHADYRFHTFLGRTAALCPQMSPGQLAGLLSSLAKLRFRPDDSVLQSMVEPCVTYQARDLGFGSSARILTAMARLDYQLVDLGTQTRLIEGLALPTTASGDMEGVSTALWWLVVSGAWKVYPEMVEVLLKRANTELRLWEYAGEPSAARGKQRLRVCRQLGWVLKYPLNTSAAEELQDRVNQALTGLSAWRDPTKGSRLQEGVLRAALAHDAICEAEWTDGVMSIDFVLSPRRSGALPVAVEVDGPSHFYVNKPRRPTGQTLCKTRTLREAYKESLATVINVPHWGWPRKDQKSQGRFLWDKLKAAGLDPTLYISQCHSSGSK